MEAGNFAGVAPAIDKRFQCAPLTGQKWADIHDRQRPVRRRRIITRVCDLDRCFSHLFLPDLFSLAHQISRRTADDEYCKARMR